MPEKGVVKWFSSQKGWGFVSPSNGGKDLFVHHTGIDMEGYRELKEGDVVTYEVEEGRKGLQAVNVRVEKK